ncbi:hypothetical protein H4582DRAFT_1145974 [Lactarius indigo]|nr:hypothetical protein H4582DRAFT_1145974 [Lactarius indigo]
MFLIFSLLTWFAGESTRHRTCDSLLHLKSTAHPVAPVVLITNYSALVLPTSVLRCCLPLPSLGPLLSLQSAYHMLPPLFFRSPHRLCRLCTNMRSSLSMPKSSRHGISGILSARRWCCLAVARVSHFMMELCPARLVRFGHDVLQLTFASCAVYFRL